MAEILSFGSDRPPRPARRWLVVMAVSVLGVAMAVVLARRNGEEPGTLPSPAGSVPVAPSSGPAEANLRLGGLVLAQPAGLRRDLTQQRFDRTAQEGPWAVVVRRVGGSLARGGAVVTFPMPEQAADDTEVFRPVAGAYARVRGDLGRAELTEIAERVTVTAGRLRVDPPTGYVVASEGPYRPTVVHEAGYGSAAAGEEDTLGPGWIHTGVAPGGGLEDQLYAANATAADSVLGHQAVLSGIREGDGMLSWEPEPGMIAFVGYGGGRSLDDAAEQALVRLAGRTRLLPAAQWHDLGPLTVDQINDERHPGPWPVPLDPGDSPK